MKRLLIFATWEVDGKTGYEPGVNANLGGISGYPDGDHEKLNTPGVYKYMDGAPTGSMDSHERIQVLDEEGIDASLIYPSIL